MEKKNAGLSSREVDDIKFGLIEGRRRLAETVEKLSGEAVGRNPLEQGAISALPHHLADLGTETFEQDRDLGIAERASGEIHEIDLALERLESGTYGICDSCGEPIARERLRALPYASVCVPCKVKQEEAEEAA